jgi:hypothetical protein
VAQRNPRAPTHNRYDGTIFEEAVIINVDKQTWTCVVETRHSAKTVEDVQWMAPYHHTHNGEGFHHIPEIGATCFLCWPSDNTPPFIAGYKGEASAEESSDDKPIRSTSEEGSRTNTSFRSGRPDLNPGDIAITGRDDNFFVLRRGGVVQIGSTQVAQRMYLPITNFIRDFCENYEMATLGGTLSWTVDRQENDPSGEAPVRFSLHVHEHAQEAKASVRIRHFPINSGEGDEKTAYEINIAPQGIDTETGAVTGENYKLLITMGGDKTEVIGGSRTLTISGDDTVTVQGNRTVTVSGDEAHEVTGQLILTGGPKTIVDGTFVHIGGAAALQPAVLGTVLQAWLLAHIHPVIPNPASPTGFSAGPPEPALAPALQAALSQKIMLV